MLEEIGRPLSIILLLQTDDVDLARAAVEARQAGGPRRRHAGGDRPAARRLPREDRAGRRALPHEREPRAGSRRALDRRGVGRDRTRARAGGGARVIVRKSKQEIEGWRAPASSSTRRSQLVAEHLEPGVSMLDLDRLADEHIESKGGYPTSKGYKGFPAALVHLAELDGRPRHPERLPRAGGRPDLGRPRRDARRTRRGQRRDARGRGDRAEAQRLLDVCQEALAAGIEHAQPGNRLSDISHAVQVVVEEAGFSVVRSLVGHGVGGATTRTRRSRTTGLPAGGRSSRRG